MRRQINYWHSSAIISKDGLYRYRLVRRWDINSPQLTWVLCNPSKADAGTDDATIRKVVGFSDRWGYGAVVIFNLMAYRATDPKELLTAIDPEGISNPFHLRLGIHGDLCCAWGNLHPTLGYMADTARDLLREGSRKGRIAKHFCLGVTKEG